MEQQFSDIGQQTALNGDSHRRNQSHKHSQCPGSFLWGVGESKQPGSLAEFRKFVEKHSGKEVAMGRRGERVSAQARK